MDNSFSRLSTDFSTNVDELKQAQALPVDIKDITSSENYGEELELAISYLKAVREEASNIPDIVYKDLNESAKFHQSQVSYIEQLNELQYHQEAPVSEKESAWKIKSLEEFIQLKSKLLNDVSIDEESLKNEKWDYEKWKSYVRYNSPSKIFLSRLDAAHICELLECLIEELVDEGWMIDLHSMSWLFSIFVYLDELMAMDADLAYELQKLKRFLKLTPILNQEKTSHTLQAAIILNIFIVTDHFHQK